MNNCNRCQDKEATINITDVLTERICVSCLNDMVSKELGVTLETMLEEIVVYDYAGVRRNFAVQQRLDPVGIFVEATEDIEYGYQVAVHGELECNQRELFNKLVDKVKRYVSKPFTMIGEFPSGQKYNSIIADEIVGRIDHDEMSPSLPMIVIDGQPYTWEELGEMVKSFEGFQFRMRFFDRTDDVE